jgi:nucleoside-diphosphate-sugar epimerase
LNELLEVIKKITNNPNIQAEYQAERKGDVKHSQADNTRAREWLKYEKICGLEKGLRQTIDWWKTSRFAK